MRTVYFVYPHGPSIACPDAIGRQLSQRLRRRYTIVNYDWDGMVEIQPEPGSVLLGHPHPFPGTTFRRNLGRPGWQRIIALCPYHHGDRVQVAFLDRIMPQCDHYLALTGNYWFKSVSDSPFAHWKPRMQHVDLAVDRVDFPPLKTRFNPTSQRRFLYIGNSSWTKNVGYLTTLARAAPEMAFSWMGGGRRPIAGLRPLGFQNFQATSAHALIVEHDFFITVGRADANPATLLEAMAWGLIPVCTPQSGYSDYPGIINIPVDDEIAAVKQLRELQYLPDEQLHSLQAHNWRMLDEHFNWDRVAAQVVEAIESNDRPTLGSEPWMRKLSIGWAELTSPYGLLRPKNLWRVLSARVRQGQTR